jgi:predicted  nucleic acid-binding Zn-ribbon protein
MQLSLAVILGCASARTVDRRNPVSKVVDLLREMQGKVVADGKAETKVYDKYACWCATTTERKKDQIESGKAEIASLSNEILELKASIATKENDIATLASDIARNEDSMKKATALRQNENRAFQGETGEMQAAIGSLEKGIRVLSGAGTGGAALVELADVVERAARLTGKPASFVDQVAKIRYAPQSATVQGILKDMYDTFVVNLETMNAEEANSQHLFEDLMHTKQEQNAEYSSTKAAAEESKASDEEQLGRASENREAELAALEAAQKFFADTADACKNKADEWQERSRLRDEELAGIEKAIEILDSPEARAKFTSATATFAQVRQTSDSSTQITNVYNALKKAASATGNVKLAALAVKVRTGGHFEGVIHEIDNLVETLKEEEKQDISDRDNCIDQENENHHQHKLLQYDIRKLDNGLSKLNGIKDKLSEGIADTQDGIANQIQIMADALEARNNDHADFLQAKSDDEEAIALIKQATAALTSFNKNNDVELLDVSKPEFKISKDQAPDAKFSGAGSHSQEKNGVLAIMAQIVENMENDVKEGVATEAAEMAAYEKQRADDRATKQALENRLSDLQAEKAETEAKISAEETKKTNTEAERDAVVATLTALKPGCDWIRKNFDKRREDRKTEVEGLGNAKAMLQGASFLQKKA